MGRPFFFVCGHIRPRRGRVVVPNSRKVAKGVYKDVFHGFLSFDRGRLARESRPFFVLAAKDGCDGDTDGGGRTAAY